MKRYRDSRAPGKIVFAEGRRQLVIEKCLVKADFFSYIPKGRLRSTICLVDPFHPREDRDGKVEYPPKLFRTIRTFGKVRQ